MDDIYYACEDTSEGVALTVGQPVEVLDISDGDLWLVKTVDPKTGKAVEGMVRASSLVPTPPSKTSGQNGKVNGVNEQGPPHPSTTAAVMPGSLFGGYEPPKSMIFGKLEVVERPVMETEQDQDTKATALEPAPPSLPHTSSSSSVPVIRLQSPEAVGELQKLQEASVNSSDRLDEFDPVEMYVAIADFEATEESNISLRAGEHVQVGVAFDVM